MKKLVMLTLCFGIMCMLLADANTDIRSPITDTELPTNASPFQLQNSQMRRVPDSRVLLYSQIPTNSAGSYACQLDSVYPFDADLVEDVTPTADWTLDSIVSYVRPWGAWSSWSLVPNVRFLVYADSSIGSHPVDSPFVDIVVNQGTYETAVYGSGWLVGVPLPSSVNLTNGVTYWLEVQPCHSFAANGQTGTMSEPGIGNGVEFFYRFPALGVPVFVPASAGGWPGCEGGIELYGTSGPPPDHDVGTTAINDPGLTIGPNTTINPTATYKNFGTATETFDIYFVIDSSSTILYNETANITLDPGVDTTYSFTATWTSGPNDGIVYDIMAYTVLGPDINPANDTLTQQTIVSMVGNWIQCASLPTPEECQATAYDSDNGHIYSFGGTPDGGVNYHNFTYQYDPITDTWATMTNMPYAVDWIDASYINGNFYIFGGFDGGSPYTYNMIYNVAGDSWSNGASMPLGRMAAGQVAYNDSLIYMLGGYNGSAPSSDVQIYNVYTDAWTTGTALPQTNMMQGVAMTGDTIWLVGGYNGSAAYSTLYYGVINPSTCETIVWSTGSALPVANFNNGATQLTRDGKWFLYMVGGFENAASITNHAWEYDVELDTWTALPNYPMTICRNDYLIGHEYRTEIYVVGGDPSGGWTATDQVWKLPWYTGIAEKPNQSEPAFTFGFASNFRNPVNGDALISYVITRTSSVTLKVYDGSGRLVSTLVNNTQNPGTKTVTWNAQNLANGVYFVRLEAEGKVDNRKMILVK